MAFITLFENDTIEHIWPSKDNRPDSAFEVDKSIADRMLNDRTLSLINGELVKTDDRSFYYISPDGNKSHKQSSEYNQMLICKYSDRLIKAGKLWRVVTLTDKLGWMAAEATAQIDELMKDVYTGSVSRSAVYTSKMVLATAYKEAGYPVPVPTEFTIYLVDEAAARGITVKELADIIIAKATSFATLSNDIEVLRIDVKSNIKDSGSIEEAEVKSNEAIDLVKKILLRYGSEQ